MKKIILLLLFTLTLYANSEPPKWIVEDPDNSGKYFRGISDWYISDDINIVTTAKVDALESAHSKAFNHFEIDTNQLISSLKPIKSYIETSEEKSRLHVLIYIDEYTQRSIDAEVMAKKEFDTLKEQILLSIENKKYFKAKDALKLIKKRHTAYIDEDIKDIEKRLTQIIKDLLLANIILNKKTYLPDESIELEVSLNKNGYLYLFYETGSDVQMIFPNESQSSAYLKKGELLSFPNDNIKRITAYEEDLGNSVKFYSVASKKDLYIKSLSLEREDGIYIYEKTGKYIKLIQSCIDDGECIKSVVNFKISNNTSLEGVELEFLSDDVDKESIIKYFKSKGVVSEKSSKKIDFNIKKISKYSRKPNISVDTFKITLYLYKKGTLVDTLEDECSQEELNEYLFEMYNELEKV